MGSLLLLYHGSNIEVAQPDAAIGRQRLDFGPGFYTTTMSEQAEAWAKRKAYESFQNHGVVSVYEFIEADSLSVLLFDGYSYDWLLFVVENRRSDAAPSWHGHDVVIGGIADDRVIDSINYYIEEISIGRASDELVSLTLKQLSYQKPNDQICFSTEKSLASLRFLKSYEVQA
jgi:hypothetical protein